MSRARAACALAAAALAAACGAAGAPAPGPVAPPPRTVQLNAPGAAVDIEAHVVSGYVTVVDFWAEYCGACTVVAGMLAVQIASEPRILVRKVDVGDGATPVARAYQIGALPHFRIYDKHRRLRYLLVGNDTLTAADLAKELLAEP
ncbi:MAG TPA: thioredoxin family protein [Kofleriaceae bacterium]|nr:thioredoxin family protein [Kofleriaceae bacterium]